MEDNILLKSDTHTNLLLCRNITNPLLPYLYIKKFRKLEYYDQTSQKNEYEILKLLSHPNIIRTYCYNETDKSISLDFIKGVDLFEYLDSEVILTEYQIYLIFKQIVTAVMYCHQNNIAHRDLKLENIMIKEDGKIILIDFEFSCNLKNNKTINITKLSGTLEYLSPEILNHVTTSLVNNKIKYVFKNEIDNITYDPIATDVWCIGIILYELIFRRSPKLQSSSEILLQEGHLPEHNIYALIVSDPKFCFWNGKKNIELKNLLQGLLQDCPKKRYTIQDILNSKWMNKFKSIENKLKKGSTNYKPCTIMIKNNKYYEINHASLMNKGIRFSQLYEANEKELALLSNGEKCVIL